MADIYDPFNRRRPPQNTQPTGRRPVRNVNQHIPTLEDYAELAKAYQELQTVYKEQVQKLNEQAEQIAVKDEAIKRQSADINELDGQLLWTRAALEQAQNQVAEYEQKAEEKDEPSWQERYTRLQAEMENLRKRWEQRAETKAIEERNRVLVDMLSLADHLDLALQHANKEQIDSDPGNAHQQFVKNIEATLQAFLSTLERYGIARLDALGQQFDPNFHEAIGQSPSESVPADHIVEVVQAGYVDGEKLLRPARVLVSSGELEVASEQ